uniref:Dihydroorotate dehydrogenase n=1 Tax=candidate division WOR-3 bacterium TaxID=2052148 RepID=A0A7C6EA09_UNCW3
MAGVKKAANLKENQQTTKRAISVDLKVTIKNVVFANPVLLASGTYGLGEDFVSVINKAGGFVTKGITLAPSPGNPPPRIYELPGAILNSIGLENPGAFAFRKKIIPRLRFACPLIVNIAGFSVEDFVTLVKIIDCERVLGFEVNVSCPNVAKGGAAFGQDPKQVSQIIKGVRRTTKKLIITKLTANFVDPAETAKAAWDEGSDAISLINTLYGLAIDAKTGKYFLGGRVGGLSGPALKPFALFCVERVSRAVNIPIIGGGGITNATDVCEFLLAGASLVQIGSINLINPFTVLAILEDLEEYMRNNQIKTIKDLTASVNLIGRTRSNNDTTYLSG